MENERQQDQPQAPNAPIEQAPDPTPQGTDANDAPQAPTPAHEEADRAAGREVDDDPAPDADEPGDDVAPEELQQFEQETPDQPDRVDQEG